VKNALTTVVKYRVILYGYIVKQRRSEMKNKDKFATAEEAYSAWKAFCDAQPICIECKYTKNLGEESKLPCNFRWFYDEAPSTPQWQTNILNKFTSKE
jgi:hypothetical protein